METGLTKNQIISELTRSPHGDLEQYVPIGLKAANEDPNFFAHLVAWNQNKGQIRDAKVALPVLALTSTGTDAELRDNALAHVASLDPRNLVRAVRFAKALRAKPGGDWIHQRSLNRLVERYLRDREAEPGRFDRAALQHKGSLKELYALLHIKPGERAQRILFDGAKIGVFQDVVQLANMAPDEIAGTIMRRKIPFLVAMGALGKKSKDPAVVQALIGAMSPAELVTNTKMLERLGMKTSPALRAAYEAGLQKAAVSTKVSTLKTTRAAEAVGGVTAEKLKGVQEKQIDAIGVQGDWLVLADKSGSMSAAIETARQVAALLGRVAKGKVHLIFFNDSPAYHDVTGMDYDKILEITKRVMAGGGTCIGCGVEYARLKKIEIDGIAIVSDGGENQHPAFRSAYDAYVKEMDKEVPVYFYKVRGEPDVLTGNCERNGLRIEIFDLTKGVDYYSLPNMIQTMRTNRFSLADEILATPLLRLEDVFKLAA